jgi:hypothetical protein
MKTFTRSGLVAAMVGAVGALVGCAAPVDGVDGTPAPAETTRPQAADMITIYHPPIVLPPPSGLSIPSMTQFLVQNNGTTTASQTVTIANGGSYVVTLAYDGLGPSSVTDSLGVVRTNPFSVTASTCPTTGSFALSPGQSCSMTIKFAPPVTCSGSPAVLCTTQLEEYETPLLFTISYDGWSNLSFGGTLMAVSGVSAIEASISFPVAMATTIATGQIGAPQNTPVTNDIPPTPTAGWNTTASTLLTGLADIGCTGPKWVKPDATRPGDWWLVSMCPANVPSLTAAQAAADTAVFACQMEEPIRTPLGYGELCMGAKFSGATTPVASNLLPTGVTPGESIEQLAGAFGGAYTMGIFIDFSGGVTTESNAPAGYEFVYYNDPGGSCSSATCIGSGAARF